MQRCVPGLVTRPVQAYHRQRDTRNHSINRMHLLEILILLPDIEEKIRNLTG